MNKTALLLIILILILGTRFLLFYLNQPQYRDGQDLSFETTLLSEPHLQSRFQRLRVELPNGQRILITTILYPQFHYGETLRISGSLRQKVLTPIQSGLNNKRYILVMNFPKIEAVTIQQNQILALTGVIRQKIISLFEKSLPSNSASLLLGIVFGIKENMSKGLADNLRISGVLHVVAASGMNVTMVGGFLASVFSFFLKRQIALAASIIGILFYALLAGLEPSIIRASIMGILVFSAQILGRQNLAVFGLFLAGFLMLFVKPPTLFDIGFQLSFLATLGLLYLKPLIEQKRLKTVLNKSIIGEGATTTISAQLATLPILLVNFGTYSIYSVVANGLVLWTIPILMVIGGIGALTGLLAQSLGQLVLFLTLPLLFYFEKVISVFSAFSGIITFETLPWQFILGYYSLLIAVAVFFSKKKS